MRFMRTISARIAIATVTAAMIMVATAGLATMLAQPAAATVGPVRGAAFIWANSPTTSFYNPPYPYSENSSQPFNGVDSITRTGVGSYTIRHLNLGIVGGTVHVTAYGSDTTQCKVVSWYPSGNDQLVNVKCHDLRGLPVDTLFTENYTNLTNYQMAYFWADQPSTASYTPSPTYQHNPSGTLNRITRSSVGTYTAFLPTLGANAGHVEVTAYGSGTERCKVVNWGPSGSDQAVRVNCFTVSGQSIDTWFTLTYVNDKNILGLSSDGNASAYGWASNPNSASYALNQLYEFNSSVSPGQGTATRLGVGDYATNYPVSLQTGNVQVTAYGSGPEFCKVAYWNSTDGIRVRCYNTSGASADTQYDVAFTSTYKVP